MRLARGVDLCLCCVCAHLEDSVQIMQTVAQQTFSAKGQ